MFAAEYPVSLAVNGFGGQKTLVTKVEGDLSIILDTLTADRFGLFKTTFTDDDETGFYKFIFPQLNNAEVPFIFNKEDIAITTEAVNPNAYIQVMVSKENSLYYQFVMNDAIFNNQVEFYLSQDNQNIKIILSDQKDPFWQISSLQDIIKTARINHQSLKLVDLSPAHPYATFKNN